MDIKLSASDTRGAAPGDDGTQASLGQILCSVSWSLLPCFSILVTSILAFETYRTGSFCVPVQSCSLGTTPDEKLPHEKTLIARNSAPARSSVHVVKCALVFSHRAGPNPDTKELCFKSAFHPNASSHSAAENLFEAVALFRNGRLALRSRRNTARHSFCLAARLAIHCGVVMLSERFPSAIPWCVH
jgi:hypothetical protein